MKYYHSRTYRQSQQRLFTYRAFSSEKTIDPISEIPQEKPLSLDEKATDIEQEILDKIANESAIFVPQEARPAEIDTNSQLEKVKGVKLDHLENIKREEEFDMQAYEDSLPLATRERI